jgi:hypothetical protein
VVGRCRLAAELPAPPATRRLVFAPDAAAVVSQSGPSGGGATLPEALVLGRDGSGAVSLLLHFAVPLADDTQIAAAFLVLDPAPGAPPPRDPVPVQVARIVEPWSDGAVSWGRHPRLDLPEKAGVVGAPAGAPARIEVTRFVRIWSRRRPDDHGIALLADAVGPFGAAFSMGITEGQGPRLEVYVR